MEPPVYYMSKQWINMDTLCFLFLELKLELVFHRFAILYFQKRLSHIFQNYSLKTQKLLYHILMSGGWNEYAADWKVKNLSWLMEFQIMFQPQNWQPKNFLEANICSNHRAIRYALVGNHGEHWGSNSFLVKTGHTTVAIKLKGM